MAAKRFLDDSGTDPDHPNGKRIKTSRSLASVIGEVVTGNFLQNFCSTLEPMLRRVVNEEVENSLRRVGGRSNISRSPSLRIQAPEPTTSSLQLIFNKKLSLPIFTGTKILDADNSPLEILLFDVGPDHQLIRTSLARPIRVEIVVLDGDFPAGESDAWSSAEFEKNIVKERTGKRPLLTGCDQGVTMRDGFVAVGEIEFTDNSSWIRSRKFKLGARVAQGSCPGVRIREAMTESFVVKDHRGELYRKHHPPNLEDEVWRLEKIGKDGAFHKKLASAGVKTVQDFLKMSVVDPSSLRKILGMGMSDKMWEVTVKHARTCVMGNKLYVSQAPDYSIILNPVCQILKATIGGQPPRAIKDLHPMERACVERLVREAYHNWNCLEEIEVPMNETPLLTQGDGVEEHYPNCYQQTLMGSYHQEHAFLTNGSMGPGPGLGSASSNEWLLVQTGVGYNISESSSDGELR
ncbi:protein SAR DEFICIENT 1 [Diospyros lotus]|uniref:protein SAR DEFICIENT 1 n=1 Tax=Diospyros lotus TaxID=55363 RepID=UPI00225A31C1|nr:protein SAR DEFICIENT 1 [Diospyros lotus]